jgi:hypothetical protein
MNQLVTNQPPQNYEAGCAGLTAIAEREFVAFFNTVKELFGSELAELSAEDWLQELDATTCLPTSTRDWRRITLNVLKRLATRLNASCIPTTSLVPA